MVFAMVPTMRQSLESMAAKLFKVAAATFRRPLAWNFGFRIVVSLFQERDFKISGSGAFGFQYFRLRSFPISRFPASERQDFNIASLGASKSRIFNENQESLILIKILDFQLQSQKY